MWWATHPIVYTLDDFEGHRIRFLIAEKATYCGTQILRPEEKPVWMPEINPDARFPIYVDRQIVCWGEALEELLHERYPSPSLLPVDPVKRAQVRTLSAEVRSWYDLGGTDLMLKLREFAESYDGSLRFFCGGAINAVDIAVAPLLRYALHLDWNLSDGSVAFERYVDRLIHRGSFQRSLESKMVPAPVVEPEVEDEYDTAG